jgi:acyl-CoA thioesterase-1
MRPAKFCCIRHLILLRFLVLCFLLVSAYPAVGEQAPRSLRVLVMGDSIAAGYGLDPGDAFPAQLQRIADDKGVKAEIVNGGLSGETSAGGVRRIDWLLRQPVDVFVLLLGGNDALRGLAVDDTERNLMEIIRRVRDRYPAVRVVLAGMKAPPNLGPDFTNRFEAIYRRVAEATQSTLIPFVLEGVAGVPALNQTDGIHPTVEGQRIIAKTVWTSVEPLVRAPGD